MRLERGRDCAFNIVRDHRFQFGAGLGVVRQHHFGELLLVGIAFLLCDCCSLDFRHVAHGGFLDEVFGLGAMPRAGSTTVFSPTLGKRGRGEDRKRRKRGKDFLHVISSEKVNLPSNLPPGTKFRMPLSAGSLKEPGSRGYRAFKQGAP